MKKIVLNTISLVITTPLIILSVALLMSGTFGRWLLEVASMTNKNLNNYYKR